MGYQKNEYDWCVMNNLVDGKQFTIILHIDNLKMLHVDFDIFSGVPSDINEDYGKITKMTITGGKIHRYLMMNINYSSPGKVRLSMVDYIENMLDEIP